MKIGYIGLGKMGFNMVERLCEQKSKIKSIEQINHSCASLSWASFIISGNTVSINSDGLTIFQTFE